MVSLFEDLHCQWHCVQVALVGGQRPERREAKSLDKDNTIRFQEQRIEQKSLKISNGDR